MIFVRRVNSTSELERVLIQNYDEEINKLVKEMLNIVEESNTNKIIKQLEKTINATKEENNEEDEETEKDIYNEAEENEDTGTESEWLKQIKENKKENEQTKLFLFKKKFYKNMAFADFLEENFLNLLGYSVLEVSNIDNEKKSITIFLNNKQNIEITDEDIRNKIKKYKISISKKSIKNTDIKRIVNLIIFEKLENIDNRVKVFKDVYKEFYFVEEEKETVDVVIDLERIKKYIIADEKNSIWEIEKIREVLSKVSPIDSIKVTQKDFARREIIKDIIVRNLRNSEGIIYFYCLYIKASSKFEVNSQILKKEFEQQINDNCLFAKRIFNRIVDFINNFDVENKILGIDLSKNENIQKYIKERNKAYVYLSPIAKCSSIQKKSIPNIAKCFNTSFFPDIMIATDIVKEGIDLQINCSNIIHYGIAWLPGDIEQRIGRIDRYFSKTYRDLKINPNAKINIYFIYSKNTMDEVQVSRVIGKMIKSIVFKDEMKFENIQDVDSIDENIKKLNKICKTKKSEK